MFSLGGQRGKPRHDCQRGQDRACFNGDFWLEIFGLMEIFGHREGLQEDWQISIS